MNPATLSVVARPEPIAERVKRLQAEAASLAHEHILDLEIALRGAAAIAAEVASGGDAYPVGIRDIAERMAPDLEAASLNIESLRTRKARAG